MTEVLLLLGYGCPRLTSPGRPRRSSAPAQGRPCLATTRQTCAVAGPGGCPPSGSVRGHPVQPWVDGIDLSVRLDQEKSRLPATTGVRADVRRQSSRSPTAPGDRLNPGPDPPRASRAAAACGAVLVVVMGASGFWEGRAGGVP